jgi:hypothetical protein
MPSQRSKNALPIVALLAAGGAAAMLANVTDATAAGRPVLPQIRVSHTTDGVPACVTPSRLMRHVMERTPDLEPRFRDIARYYKQHGEALGIRWDYAFYQMLLETNYLAFRRGDGSRGDVHPRQNNFAGIGATGGGVPGDSFPDVSTGVKAQMQHLVAYSGEPVPNPAAARTREKQDDIVSLSRRLRRPVRFDDLTNRWAKDRNYAASIEVVADRYRQANCTPTGAPRGASDDEAAAGRDRPRLAGIAPPPPGDHAQRAPAAPRAGTCDVLSASYGGRIALLIRAEDGGSVSYTVLQVEEGQEQRQADAFIRAHMPNGRTIARFASRDGALARAFELCPAPS